METFKKLIALMLVFSFTTQGLIPSALAIEELEEDEVEFVPTNPPGTPPGVQCKVAGQNPGPLGVCCVGFERNRAGVCDEPTVVDPSLTSCSSSTECSGGTGCYPQSNEDLFSPLSGSADQDKASDVMAQISDVEGPIKNNGESCVHAKECKSYNCAVGGKCEAKNVCRLADEGEVAGPGVNCGKDMIKNGSGVCTLSPEAKNGTYLGLLDEAVIGGDDKTCQFTIDDKTQEQSIVAMQSLRAMEWMFSTISLDQKEECFDVLPTLKHEIGTTFFETRKNILTNFTDELNIIEFDFKQLIEAKENGTKQISIHKGEQIAESDLATRQTSGYDSLVMMYRRNLLFQSYEQAMLDTVKNANTKLVPMSEMLAALKDGDSNSPCEGSRYKTKKPLRSWKTKYWDKVKDHWANQYEVSGSAAGNADIIKRERVATVLALIGGKPNKEDAIAEFTKSKYFLMDPLMFEGMRNGSYGDTKKLKKKSSFLGLFGGFKDLRHAYYLRGTGSGSYTKMYNELRPKLREFYKKLKVRGDQKGFVYEPELLTTEAKDCLDNPEKPEKCAGFEGFLDGVMDEAFAHFIAWGYANRDSYEGFFTNAQTYRRALLRKLEVDMSNISKYYETVISHRNRQNDCIDRVINGLKVPDGVLAKDDSGLQEGGVYYDSSADNKGGLNLGKGSTALKTQKLNAIDRTKFTFDLKNGNLSKLADGTILDNVLTPGTTSSRAGVSDSASAFLASRGKAMKDANKKASALGVDVKSKEKAVKDSIASLAKKSGSSLGSSGVAGAGSSSRGAGFGSSDVGSSSVGKGEVGQGSAGTGEGVNGDKGTIGLNSAGAGAGNATDGLAGVDSGSGSGAGYGANGANGEGANGANDPNAKDASGLTDAEREKMLSEAERNKRDYKGSEEDGLFGKVSKAYVRNLDKVLIRKKKLD